MFFGKHLPKIFLGRNQEVHDVADSRLTDQEWDLVEGLLEREQNELPTEIHHTGNSTVREELQKRLVMVRELLDRLRNMACV